MNSANSESSLRRCPVGTSTVATSLAKKTTEKKSDEKSEAPVPEKLAESKKRGPDSGAGALQAHLARRRCAFLGEAPRVKRGRSLGSLRDAVCSMVNLQ